SDPRQDSWCASAQGFGVWLVEANGPPGQWDASASTPADSSVVGYHIGPYSVRDPNTALMQRIGIGVQSLAYGCGRRIQGCFQCGQCELIRPKRPRQWM